MGGTAAGNMDAYLEIAEEVLRSEKRPLSPRAILASAYRRGIVPIHLHGKTQHKTLGARISEDIILRRERSIFFRTAPGRFFLRAFLSDENVPEKYRTPIVARRRVRDLLPSPALAVDRNALYQVARENSAINAGTVLELLRADAYRYDDPRQYDRESVFVRSFVAVRRNSEVLSYRLGRYRDDRDGFMSRRSIGFSTLVHRDDRTLFSAESFGIVECGLHATMIDLDIPPEGSSNANGDLNANLIYFLWVSQTSGADDLLAVINFDCPSWFEPTRRRLALNELRWLDLRAPINNLDDFDPWSRSVLLEYYRLNLNNGASLETARSPAR